MNSYRYYSASISIWASSLTPKDQIVCRQVFLILFFELWQIPFGWMAGNDLSYCLLINKPKCYLKPFHHQSRTAPIVVDKRKHGGPNPNSLHLRWTWREAFGTIDSSSGLGPVTMRLPWETEPRLGMLSLMSW